ncbi:hypothetical protein IT411_03495 [Candidatus Peregrinibacteria bacterium]|nr:hypothetical protein [Candidatus Peregrinibacteria bacterium]
MQGLDFIEDSTWEEVFANWRADEAEQPSWQECARKKGWDNWESWRNYAADRLSLSRKKWRLYEVQSPQDFIPEMLVGPFKSWQQHLKEEQINELTFAEYVELESKRLSTNNKIVSLLWRFPRETQLIALRRPDRDQLTCFEGTHRSLTTAVAKKHGIALPASIKVRLAVANLIDDDLEILKSMAKGGTEKPDHLR